MASASSRGSREDTRKNFKWQVAFGKPGGLVPFLSPRCFLLIRGLLFVVWLATNAWGIYTMVVVYDFPMEYYMTKLTSWTSILLLVYLGFAFYSTCKAQPGGDGRPTGIDEEYMYGPDKMPGFISITWILHTVNLVVQPMMTLMCHPRPAHNRCPCLG
jgi:hypothetical protein